MGNRGRGNRIKEIYGTPREQIIEIARGLRGVWDLREIGWLLKVDYKTVLLWTDAAAAENRRAYQQLPEVKAREKKRGRVRQRTPEVRAKDRARKATPEAKARQREYRREYWQRPEVKARQRTPEVRVKDRARKATPEAKARQREYMREYNQRDYVKAKDRERHRKKRPQ